MLALTAFLAGTLSVIAALLVIRFLDRLAMRDKSTGKPGLEQPLRPIIFLFRDQKLVDATPSAHMLLSGISGSGDPWARLGAWITPRFPDFAARLETTAGEPLDLLGEEGNGSARCRLVAEPLEDGLLRITLTDPQSEHAGIVVDSLAQQALEEELDLLRNSLDKTPMLVWRQDAEGQISWANRAYVTCAERVVEGQAGWPLPPLFDCAPGAARRRAQIEFDGHLHWYDCSAQQVGDQTMMFALPADAAVRAERSLREFVQTLTKTFADLPIGLAIFDRERRLQLFNPALIELTGLPTGFLTARPSLFDLLDRLREARMVPEPRDYRSWRQQMANLEAAAATGHHVETWSLPGGQTYRVTGRPHPDGAVAFLFEDITSEISLTRKFRAELMLGGHVLDALDDAVAVFAANGQMVLSNSAYKSCWDDGGAGLKAALATWQAHVGDGPGFAALQTRLTGGDARARGSGAMAGADGELIGWTVVNLSGGRQMVRFSCPTALTAGRQVPEAETVATKESGEGPAAATARPVTAGRG